MTQETFVRLKITSTIHDPEYISTILGIPCDRGWRIGDKRPKTIITEKTNGWILNSGLDKASSFDEQIAALMTRLDRAKTTIREQLASDEREVSCVIYAQAVPSLNFSPEVIAQVNLLGASLDIDLYLPDKSELP